MVVLASSGLSAAPGSDPKTKRPGKKVCDSKIVTAADYGQIVRKFISAEDGEVGQENIRS
jgi:hypothetical protein